MVCMILQLFKSYDMGLISFTSGIFTLQWQSKLQLWSNGGKRSCCHHVYLLHMKLCHKLYCRKKQLSVCKLLALLKCQLHFKQYIKKRVCFEIKFYKLTSSNGTTLFFSVNSRKSMFHNGNENSDMSPPERNPFHQLFLFKLLKITINTKTGLLMYVYFLLLWFIFWQIGISIPIWLSLWI